VQATSVTPFILKPVSVASGNTPGLLASFNKFANCTWTIATASSISNFATNKFALDTSAFANDFSEGAFAVDISGNSLVLKYVAAPLAYPRFTSVATARGGLQLGGTGGAGQAYVLWGTTNLAPAGWMPLATNLADANGVFQFSDAQVTNYPARYYRIKNP
jgi:hypothetical protein